jgi:VWFA-related protein
MRSILLAAAFLGAYTSLVTEQQPMPARPGIDDVTGRIILFVIDDLNLDFRDTPRIRALVKKMGGQLVRDGDLFAMVTTDPSSINLDLTSNLTHMDDAVKQITGHGLRPQDLIQASELSEIVRRAHVTFRTMLDQLRRLDATQNHWKAVVLISNGWDLDLSADADVTSELNDLAQLSTRTNATFYTVDPRGLVAGGQRAGQIDPNQWAPHVHTEQDNMRTLAERTGGLAVVNVDDYNKALERINGVNSR